MASVLGTVTGVLNPANIGSLPQLDVSACVPLDVTQCTSSVLAATGVANMPFVGDMLKADLRQLRRSAAAARPAPASTSSGTSTSTSPGLNAIPAGCVPIDISKCLTSVTGSLGILPTTGGVPQVDLSACMPTGLTSGIPGVGGGIPGLSGIPFFPFKCGSPVAPSGRSRSRLPAPRSRRRDLAACGHDPFGTQTNHAPRAL